MKMYVIVTFFICGVSLVSSSELRCNEQEFQCTNGACVYQSSFCNGQVDCADGSDESDCKNVTCSADYAQVACEYGACIHKNTRCDGERNCADGSDEVAALCHNNTCNYYQFRCGYGACVVATVVCDGVEDCADNSDETLAKCQHMEDGDFKCHDGSNTIPAWRVCNGGVDCLDKSDESEVLCADDVCHSSHFRCAYGGCHHRLVVCDGIPNCHDGSDELENLCKNMTCNARDFRCAYGACVGKWSVCDGRRDCADNSDELQPHCQHIISDHFECDDGTDIQGMRVCDGFRDCPDQSDETARVCAGAACHAAQIQCAYGACLINGTNCDGVKDCLDGSDESSELCGKVRCILPPSIEHGTFTVNNIPGAGPGDSLKTAALSVVCEEGYTADTSDLVFCNEGKWSVPFPKCVRYCTLPKETSVTYKCTDSATGAEETRACRGRELSGSVALPACSGPNFYATHALPHMTCANGIWDKLANCTIDCGTVTPSGVQLVAGGFSVKHGELPWHAAIYQKPSADHKHHKLTCSGSLINNNVIISAAHCFWDLDNEHKKYVKQPAGNYIVAMGKLFRRWRHREDVDVQRSDVSQILFPNGFDGIDRNFLADIAVVTVSTPFEYKPHIRPVCLSFDEEFESSQLHPDNKGKVAGWGLTSNDTTKPAQELNVIDLPYIDNEKCSRESPGDFKGYVTLDKFCVGFLDSGLALCKGDSGGGVVFSNVHGGVERFFLRGVVSGAPKKGLFCDVNVYTAITRVSQYEKFIAQYY